jgi:hypothetical protein
VSARRPRTPLRGEIYLSAEQLAAAADLSPGRLARLVRLGLVEPRAPGVDEFTSASAARLRRMLRLRSELHVNLVGATIILDLVERLDRLESELANRRETID